jgi:hypothetical protein
MIKNNNGVKIDPYNIIKFGLLLSLFQKILKI